MSGGTSRPRFARAQIPTLDPAWVGESEEEHSSCGSSDTDADVGAKIVSSMIRVRGSHNRSSQRTHDDRKCVSEQRAGRKTQAKADRSCRSSNFEDAAAVS